MAADITSDAVQIKWEDNVGIHAVWTGTPTGVLSVQISLDPVELGWETIVFSPAADQPSGAAGSNFYDLNQTGGAYVRLFYDATSGAGTLKAKISAKSV